MPSKPRKIELPDVDISTLSKQQQKIYQLAQTGKTAIEIAEILQTTRDNIDHQIKKIREKSNLTKSVKTQVKSTLHPDDLEPKNNLTKTVKMQVKSALYSDELGLNDDEYAQLTGQQAKVVYLNKRGKRVKDIAKITGLSPEAVRQHLFQARHGVGGKASPVVTRYIKDLPQEEQERIMAVGPERIDPATAAFAFEALVKREELSHDWLRALARDRIGGWRAKKTLIGAHAQAFKVLAASSRTPLIKVTSRAIRKMMADVLAYHFTQMTDDVWRPVTGNAHSIFYHELVFRARVLLEGCRLEPKGEDEFELVVPERAEKEWGLAIRPTGYGSAVVSRIERGKAPQGRVRAEGKLELRMKNLKDEEVVVGGVACKIESMVFVEGNAGDKKTWITRKPLVFMPGDEGKVVGNTLVLTGLSESSPGMQVVRFEEFEPARLADLAARVMASAECTVWYKGKAYHCRIE